MPFNQSYNTESSLQSYSLNKLSILFLNVKEYDTDEKHTA